MIELVPYGVSARERLVARIAELKGGDPLAPVTVIVPSNYAGLSLRRGLAAQRALVNVRFMVVARLAELLGAPGLNARGLRPLTPWVRLAAVRAALRERPGVFAAAMDHPSTPRELWRVFRELRERGEQDRLDALRAVSAAGERAQDVARLYRRFEELTGGFFDEFDLIEAAAEVLQSGSSATQDTGKLILYLPRTVSQPTSKLLRAAAGPDGEVHAILGLTGDPEVDTECETAARTLGAQPEPARYSAVEAPAATGIVSATEPEEEVREAIRQAMSLAVAGTPLHRIAFLYGSAEVYAGLLHDALTSADVPHNGESNRLLSQTIAGRAVLGLPRIAASGGPGDGGYARDVVLEWLTAAPIWHGGREAPSHRWDDISRDAGIVRGPEQWKSRLAYYASAQELEATQREPGSEHGPLRNAAFARELAEFVAALQASLGADERLPYSGHAAKALEWLRTYLPEAALTDEAEREARDQVQARLEEIAAMSHQVPAALDLEVSRGEFASALDEALSTPDKRIEGLGHGVFCGRVGDAGEMDFDAVFVLGMVEGAFPRADRDDPILTAPERSLTGGILPAGGERPTEARRSYLAALASAPERVLSTSRGDLRSQRATQPSRWLLESASKLAGERLYATELGERLVDPPGWFRVVHSFEAALRTTVEPGSPQEWDLASLLSYHGRIDRHFLMQPTPGNALARGGAARKSRHARGRHRLDDWTGKVDAHGVPVPGAGRPISPTALETFAKCPFRYFLGQVLKVGEMERPEEVITIEPATIGSIVHEILEHFFADAGQRPDPSADWSDAERARLRGFAREAFAKAERQGLTGKDLTWRAEQARILRDLELLLERELRDRRRDGFRFKQAEAGFGLDPLRGPTMEAATYTLANGEVIAFRGKVDRVDEGPNGELLITDYKTGSTRSYEEMKPENPLLGGKFLQLPVYALAFRGETQAPVRARYWFISEQADFVSKEVELNDSVYDAFGSVLNTLVETMKAGYFPAVPGNETFRPGRDSYENCVYCPYDALCPSSQRFEAWEEAKSDPGLISFAELATAGVAVETSDD